jgi:hypothetical protein
VRYDSNRFLLDNTWSDGGVRLSANLFRLASIPTLVRANEAQKQVDESRRMAQAMAVMTQVRVASLRYGLALSELKQVALSADVDRRLLGYARSAQSARVEGELEVIRNEARALLSEYQRHIAYANAQSAWGRIYNSLGYDVEPPPREATLRQVAEAIERSMGQWDQLTFQASGRAQAPDVPAAQADTPTAPATGATAATAPATTAPATTAPGVPAAGPADAAPGAPAAAIAPSARSTSAARATRAPGAPTPAARASTVDRATTIAAATAR